MIRIQQSWSTGSHRRFILLNCVPAAALTAAWQRPAWGAIDGPPVIGSEGAPVPEVHAPSGGGAVRIYGEGLLGTIAVSIGGVPAPDFTVIDGDLIIATVPPAGVPLVQNDGFAHITVTDDQGNGTTDLDGDGSVDTADCSELECAFAPELGAIFYTDATLTLSPSTGLDGGETATATLLGHRPNRQWAFVHLNPLNSFLEDDPEDPDVIPTGPPYGGVLSFQTTDANGNASTPVTVSASPTFNAKDQDYDPDADCPVAQITASYGLDSCFIAYTEFGMASVERRFSYSPDGPDLDPVPALPTRTLSPSSGAAGTTVAVSGVNWNAAPHFGSDTSPDDPGESALTIEVCDLAQTSCTAATNPDAATVGPTRYFDGGPEVPDVQPVTPAYSGATLSGSLTANTAGCAPNCVVRLRQQRYDIDANAPQAGAFISAIANFTVTIDAVNASDATARGDFNGDGIDDLAVGVPGENLGATADAGAVHVLYGGAGGVTATGSQLWSQDSTGIADFAETGDGFGLTMTAGDFNGDGRDDLAVGVPGENVATVVDGGMVHVIYGSASGLTATGSQLWSQNTAGISDTSETGDRFGSALASGMLDSDTFADLVIGAPAEKTGATSGAGVVHVIKGASPALTATGSQYWGQDSAGLADFAEAGDGFGATLAIGDLNAAAGQDLAIGVPGEDVASVVDGGLVHVLYGSASGLTATGSQLWSQNTTGVSDNTETGDRFGSALATGKLDTDTFAELVVGVPDETTGPTSQAGVVHVIKGASAGLTATGSQQWGQDTAGVADFAEAGDGFGATLAVGDLNAAAGQDLAIGAPGENVASVVDGGMVHVLYGSATGLTATGSQTWSQNSAGVSDNTETNDRFGSALAVGKLNNDAFAELVVGVPAETLGAINGAGMVHVIPGASGGLTGTGSTDWRQDSPGVADFAEAGDGFGASLGA